MGRPRVRLYVVVAAHPVVDVAIVDHDRRGGLPPAPRDDEAPSLVGSADDRGQEREDGAPHRRQHGHPRRYAAALPKPEGGRRVAITARLGGGVGVGILDPLGKYSIHLIKSILRFSYL